MSQYLTSSSSSSSISVCVEQNQQILGGKKTVPLKEDGRATFDNLSMREASTKHGEREFCLEFVPLSKEDQPLGSFGTRTSPFYAYSHMKVLARRSTFLLLSLGPFSLRFGVVGRISSVVSARQRV
jgi:hypothetical protein